MLSTPKKLLLIGLSALAPNFAQATFIDITSFGDKTYASQLAQIEYKFDFGNHASPHELLGSKKNSPALDAKQRWKDFSANKAISHWFNLNINSRFDNNPNYNSKELKGFLKDKGKRKYERSISVPEPGTVVLLALGLAGLGMSRRGEHRHQKQA